MNILDLILIGIVLISCIVAHRKGFLYTAFKTISSLLSIVLAYFGYKPVNLILRGTGLYNWLQSSVMGRIENNINGNTLSQQSNQIEAMSLPIPNMIKENLIRNNNPEIYKLLGADNFAEYIGGYIANFYLSIISFIVVVLLVKAVLYLVGQSLRLISRLPLIRIADRSLGVIAGFIKGIISSYIYTLVLAILIGFPKFQQLSVMLANSTLTKWFYENNIILSIIDKLFV